MKRRVFEEIETAWLNSPLTCEKRHDTKPNTLGVVQMDNLKARISNIYVNLQSLLEYLSSQGIKPKLKIGASAQVEEITFSIPVGRYQTNWFIRVCLATNSVAISGGVTKTFFGHNVWVFNNEYVQLVAILGIVGRQLDQVVGLRLPGSLFHWGFPDISIERVELTNHHVLPETETQFSAIKKIDKLFVVLFPKRRHLYGDTLDLPGITSIGRTKSTKECRVYDPTEKYNLKPEHVSQESWDALFVECRRDLRVEMIMSDREIAQWGMATVEAWRDSAKIQAYLEMKYHRFGLSVAHNTSMETFLPADVRATNPTFVDYARYWFTAGKRGLAPNKRSGSNNRFRKYMESKGFNINATFERHKLLAHGLHDYLRPSCRSELSPELRGDYELFYHWWENGSD